MTRVARLVSLPVLGLWVLLSFSVTASAATTSWNFTQASVTATAQALGQAGRGITIAVLDAAVSDTSVLSGRVTGTVDCSSGCSTSGATPTASSTTTTITAAPTTTAADQPCADSEGSAAASVAAGAGYGVAPSADILSVEVTGPSCTVTPAAVAAGIDYAVASGDEVVDVSVGDLAPAVLTSAAVTQAVAQASRAGVVVVVAAGDTPTAATITAGDSDALLVAATGPGGKLASYSSSGGLVNVAAPGGDKGTDVPWAPGKVAEGTSIASAQVAGLAALLVAQEPARGESSVVAAIETTAKKLAGAGAGLIDAQAALDLAAPATAATTTTVEKKKTAAAVVRTTTTTTSPASMAASIPAQESAPTTASPTTTVAPSTTTTSIAEQSISPAVARGGGSSSWTSHNAAPVTVAGVLVLADLAGLIWLARSRILS